MRKSLYVIILAVGMVGLVLFGGNKPASTKSGPMDLNKVDVLKPAPANTAVKQGGIKQDVNFGKTPLYFIPNKGQVHGKAAFYAKTSRYTLWMTKEGLVFDSIRKVKAEAEVKVEAERDVSRLVFGGANKDSVLVPLDKTEHRVNYFTGNDKTKWRTDIPTSKAVLYKGIYKNIDLKVYGIESLIEYDWIVKPGGKVEDISFEYTDVKSVETDSEGNLIISTKFGQLVHKRPISYQEINGKRIAVHADFKKINGNSYGFKVGDYDPNYELIIDPLVLIYSTYLGGSDYEYAGGIVVGTDGCVVVVGVVYSTDFPLQNPIKNTLYDNSDIFVSKFAVNGSSLIYSTYLGGTALEYHGDIAIDNNNCVYVTGLTMSSNFPTEYPYQVAYGGSGDVFVSKLSYNGSSLIYSTFIGRNEKEAGYGIAVDGTGSAYVGGYTCSSNFPTTTSAFDTTFNGGVTDVFVLKLSPNGTSCMYSTFIGGSKGECVRSIAVDNSGAAYITGYLDSTNFPTRNPFQSYFGGGSGSFPFDAFVTKINPTGSDLVYSTYLGGSNSEQGFDIAVDGSGSAYIVGYTTSDNFPIENAYQDWPSFGLYDCFLTKFSPDGTYLEYSTFLGGSGSFEYGKSIAVDSNGCAIVSGTTDSIDFPYFPFDNPFQRYHGGGFYDSFITMFSPEGSSLLFSTYLGGSGSEDQALINYRGIGIAVDSNFGIYVAGTTNSTDFPILNAYEPNYQGGTWDVFVSKFNFPYELPSITVTSPNGGENWRLGAIETITWDYTGFDGTEGIRLLLLKNDVVVGTIAENIQIGSGSYNWTVDDFLAGFGNDYKVRIETMDGSYWDLSDGNFSIVNPTITVTSPNGGEYWQLGTTQSITWTAAYLSDTVKITLWKDGALVGVIASELDPTAVSYTWTVGELANSTASAGSGYTIKIKEKGTVISDFSDAPFRIYDLAVTAPNGGELWKSGSSRIITWTAQGITENLRIQLVKDGNIQGTISYGVDPAAGSYDWTVAGLADGTTASPGTGYTIKLRAIDTPISDISDASFTICDLTLTFPNGGETLTIGTTQNITWTSLELTGTVKISLWDSVGNIVGNIASGIDVSLETYSWTVGTHSGGTAPAGTGYSIKIKLQGEDIADTNDSGFSLN